MPIATTTTTSTNALLLQIQSQAASSAQAFQQDFLSVYFSHLTMLQILSVIISAALFSFIIYVGIKTSYFAARIDRFRDVVLKTNLPKKRARETWNRIELHFFKGGENDLKIAIIEADKILSEALRGAGIPGVQLGDKLKKARPGQIPNIDELWQAHKLRNQIAHESNFKLKRDLAERALGIYKTALENLGVFDGPAV